MRKHCNFERSGSANTIGGHCSSPGGVAYNDLNTEEGLVEPLVRLHGLGLCGSLFVRIIPS